MIGRQGLDVLDLSDLSLLSSGGSIWQPSLSMSDGDRLVSLPSRSGINLAFDGSGLRRLSALLAMVVDERFLDVSKAV